MNEHRRELDVVIVGGSTAGLSAALLLGRARRSVLVCDEDRPRNQSAERVQGFYSRDAIPPAELKGIARRQLEPYRSVRFADVSVSAVRRQDGAGFVASLADGTTCAARYLLFATGLYDDLPPIEGLAPLWGRSVFGCPYCDGWEVRDQPLAAYARGRGGFDLALLLLGWSADVVVCSDGDAQFSPDERRVLEKKSVRLIETPVVGFEGFGTKLKAIVFSGGTTLARSAAFVRVPLRQASPLPERLGCALDAEGSIVVSPDGQTSVRGAYAAGDAVTSLHQVSLAAASGTRAAIGINTALVGDGRERLFEAADIS